MGRHTSQHREPEVYSRSPHKNNLLTGHGQGHHEECKFAEDIHVVLVLGLGFVLRCMMNERCVSCCFVYEMREISSSASKIEILKREG